MVTIIICENCKQMCEFEGELKDRSKIKCKNCGKTGTYIHHMEKFISDGILMM